MPGSPLCDEVGPKVNTRVPPTGTSATLAMAGQEGAGMVVVVGRVVASGVLEVVDEGACVVEVGLDEVVVPWWCGLDDVVVAVPLAVVVVRSTAGSVAFTALAAPPHAAATRAMAPEPMAARTFRRSMGATLLTNP